MGWAGVAELRAVNPEAGTSLRDTLAYKDGDRVFGKLVSETKDEIVFKSDRFGELHVKTGDAVVIPGEKSVVPVVQSAKPVPETAPVAAKQKEAKDAEEHAEDEEKVRIWDRFSPAQLTAAVRKFFGPWHGKMAFATESVSDTTHRTDTSLETTLKRKWKEDDVQATARYDYANTNDLKTTDDLKASGSWRHDFDKREFATYRPSVEWNRLGVLNGLPNDYVLLQQELGFGYTLLTKPSRQLRVGVSENLFDVWNSQAQADAHTSHAVVSTFEEIEFTLPWRMTLTQRGVYYPGLNNRTDGFEDRVELNKKLTETLSVGIRHEIRRHNPDGASPDYTRLRLLFGLDF